MYFWRLYSAHISSFICSADLLCTEQNIRGYTNNVLEVNQLNTGHFYDKIWHSSSWETSQEIIRNLYGPVK